MWYLVALPSCTVVALGSFFRSEGNVAFRIFIFNHFVNTSVVGYGKTALNLKQTLYFMKRIILLTIIIGFITSSYGQTPKPETKLKSLTKLDLGLQGIGLTFEPRLSNTVTTDLSLGFGGGYNISEESINYQVFKPALYFSVTPKYFYNLKKRINNGKTIQYNSGNYIGVRLKYNMPLYKKSDIIRNSILTNIHWGIQRVIGNHWTINSHIGVGYAQDIDYDFGTIYPAIDFKFSYIF